MRTILKIFMVTLALFTFIPANAIEEIQAKTQKPVPEAEEQTNFEGFYPQTDGMSIPNPFAKREKVRTMPTPTPKSEMTMDSDEVEYNNETNEVTAKGHVVVITKPDNTKLTADRGVFNRSSNIIKLYDNVTLYKDGGKMTGDYMVINLNEENILMNEPTLDYTTFKITGREGYAYANKIESVNGEIALAQKMDVVLASYGFGGGIYDTTIVPQDLATHEMRKQRAEPFKIHTKEIVIRSDKDHDNITFKNADVYYKKFKLATASNIQIYTDKEQKYVETNIPEIGSMSNFGTFIGPGFVTKAPFGSTLKIIPVVASSDGVGFGGIVRARSKRNFTEAAWNSGSNDVILRGKYKFNDDLRLEYARHAYVDEWFYGARRPGVLAQLVHHKVWDVPNLDATFAQRITGGFVSEYDLEKPENDFNGTARLRWQGELSKSIYSIGDKEQDMFLDFRAVAQAGATVYGTGDTSGVFRIGPYVYSRVKNWGSRINLAIAGIHGCSPYRFDEYRYGKVSVTIDENYRLNKYIAVGYQGTFTPLKDNPEEDLIAENKFYVVAGPEDVKVAFSYDTKRELAVFDVLFLLGSDAMKTKYDKLTIENIQTLGKKRELFEDLQYYKIKVPEEL